MKKMYLAITVAVVNEQTPLLEELKAKPKYFMETLMFPLFERTRPLSEEELESYRADSRAFWEEESLAPVYDAPSENTLTGRLLLERLFE